MVATVNPPPLQVPTQYLQDKSSGAFFGALVQTLYQLWTKTFQISFSTSVKTSDATVTPAVRVTVADGRTVMLDACIVARRTGGSAGVSGDSAWYKLSGAYKNIGGVLTGIGSPSLLGGEDQATWNVGFTSASNYAIITVQGAANNDITWETTVSSYEVGA